MQCVSKLVKESFYLLKSCKNYLQFQFGEDTDDGATGDTKPSLRNEMENIYKVLTYSREKLETENDVISDEIRSNFSEYKTHMEDITPE